MYIYIYIYVFLYISIYIYIYDNMYIYIYTYTCVFTSPTEGRPPAPESGVPYCIRVLSEFRDLASIAVV